MISTKEYIDEYRKYDDINYKVTEYNRELVKEYPFLLPHSRWTDKVDENYDYSYTEMDSMPVGWRLAFGDQLLKEIKDCLVEFNCLDDYRILQIKEKYGSLRWYDSGCPIGILSDVDEIVKVKNWKDAPSTDSENYWRYTGWDEEDNYVLEHRKILKKCPLYDIIRKYERLSKRTCINCGKPATKISTGWISPWCDDCANNKYESYIPIEDFYEKEG